MTDGGGGHWRGHFVLVELLADVDMRVDWDIHRAAMVAGALAILLAAVVPTPWESGAGLLLRVVGWAIGVVVFVLLALELSARLLLSWYGRRSKRLVGAINSLGDALGEFNDAYDASLALVKRAELASRGYRLGAGLLPPIGRLEASNADNNDDDGAEKTVNESTVKLNLRCLPLRRRLRKLNEHLQAITSTFLKEDDKKIPGFNTNMDTVNDTIDAQAPSLLLTALAKQRIRAVLLLESAVQSVLVRTFACACFQEHVESGDYIFRVLVSMRIEVDQLIHALHAWTIDLKTWNTTSGPAKALSSASEPDKPEGQRELQPSQPLKPRLFGVATHLQELRSSSETLSALVIAAQYELHSGNTAIKRVANSREAMQSMVQQVQEAWGRYESALSSLTSGNDSPQATPEKSQEEESHSESKPVTVASPSRVPTAEDPNYTVVFTGTSTGDEGFDLQALLNQQETDATTTPSPTPYFVRELRDVLAHRQALAQPGLTRQVEHDPPVLSLPSTQADRAPAPPPANAMFALPRAPPRSSRQRQPPHASQASQGEKDSFGTVTNAFNMELQALLQRSQPMQQQDFLESLGDSDDHGMEASN
ncbi:unnamed protein product [Phytophthora lilii]|uniref:Unnamed protein product n=1 Tax=Phytophthora lilii TaxID=2077276 RepID=A0A9W6TJY4_9STRA|nr:unnamed protein product [Phytophthora lilii]